MTQPPRDEVADLTRAANDLIERIDALNHDSGATVERIAKETRRNRHFIVGLMISFALDIALTVALAIGGAALDASNKRIDRVQSQIRQDQTVQRQKALCPLYKLFLDQEKYPPPPGQAPEQLAGRAAAFKTIRDGYAALHCKDVTN